MNMEKIDAVSIEAMPQRFRANFINSLSGYKSANLIGTCNENKHTNLAIVSSVVHIGAHPPLMGMIMRPHSVVRDTLANIKQTGFFTINALPVELYTQGHQTSARYDSALSEFEECGFTAQWQTDFYAPFVKESPLSIGLELEDIIPIKTNNTEMVIGRIQQVLLNKDNITGDGTIDIATLELAAVSGLDTYHKALPVAKMAYAKPDKAASAVQIFNSDQ